MRAWLVALLLTVCAFARADDVPECKTPDVEAVQRVLNQQATQIMLLREQYEEQQRTIDDLRVRLWNAMQRQQA